MFASRFRVSCIIAALAAPVSGHAIIRGTPTGSSAASAVMVLNDRGGFCTGFFIASHAVLTAAHCVAGTQVRIMMDGQMVAPLDIKRHSQYRAGAIANRQTSIDLALLRLGEASPQEAELSLAPPPRAGAVIEARGFGLTREGDAKSTGQYHSVSLSVAAPYGIGKFLVWAQNADGGGGCQGDSGGPIVDGNNRVIAVISWSTGHNGRQCGHYTQGTLIAPHRSWIDSTLQPWGMRARWSQ